MKNPFQIRGLYLTASGDMFHNIVKLNPNRAYCYADVVASTIPGENNAIAAERAGALVAELFEAHRGTTRIRGDCGTYAHPSGCSCHHDGARGL